MFADIGGGFYPPLSRLMKLEMDTLEERAKIAKICFPPLPHPPANHYHLHHQMSVLQPDSNLLTQKREMGLCSSTTTYKDDLAHEPTQKKKNPRVSFLFVFQMPRTPPPYLLSSPSLVVPFLSPNKKKNFQFHLSPRYKIFPLPLFFQKRNFDVIFLGGLSLSGGPGLVALAVTANRIFSPFLLDLIRFFFLPPLPPPPS